MRWVSVPQNDVTARLTIDFVAGTAHPTALASYGCVASLQLLQKPVPRCTFYALSEVIAEPLRRLRPVK